MRQTGDNLKYYDLVVQLHRLRWCTRAVLEGLTSHYHPRVIHLITPSDQIGALTTCVRQWATSELLIHDEDQFFAPASLTKQEICASLDLSRSLYTPGWFYQQLLKLGADEGIPDCSEWFVVWDSDLLPVDAWPLLDSREGKERHAFALLQHRDFGNHEIVSHWEQWIHHILKISALHDHTGTFIPHHMWFNQSHLTSYRAQLQAYYRSADHWTLLMMASVAEFGTFSEYWSYASWHCAAEPDQFSFHPYEQYGRTTERFFEDGTGRFARLLQATIRATGGVSAHAFSPSYEQVVDFLRHHYGAKALPSSLCFESSPRHLNKPSKTMHLEERRSQWLPRERLLA